MKFMVLVITLSILHVAWSVTELTLDLKNPTEDDYSSFLTELRDNVKDSKLKYGDTDLPVIGKPTNTYLRVNVETSAGIVAFGLKRNDLYLVAYLAKNERQKNRVYYFKDQVSSSELDQLFPEAKGAANQQQITEYSERYAEIEYQAKAKKKNAGLGIRKLVTYMEAVNGRARQVQAEAKFLLVAIQMVSEAARFRYIENMVIDNFPNGFTPDDKTIILESNWEKISQNIKDSDNGKFKQPVVYKANNQEVSTTWRVTNAAEVNVGILMYLK